MTGIGLVERIAARGDGVTDDGRHVRFTAPGDQVTPDGKILPGPHHAVPPCRHFPECGGCQLQHLDYTAYAAFVTQRVTGAIEGQGLALPTILPPHISPPRTRRRTSLRAARMGKKVLLGFNAESSHKIIDMRMCEVLRPELFALVEPLRRLIGGMMVDRRSAEVTLTLCDQGVDVLLGGVEADGLRAAEALTAFAQDYRLARLSLDDGYGAQTRWEPDPATISLGGVPVELPAGAFLQATEDGEAALVTAVKGALPEAGPVADLFAGLGTFALNIAGQRPVYAAEAARDAVLALKGAANRAQRRVAVDHRDLFRRPLTAAECDRFAAIVLDPPRAGAREQVAALAASAVPVIAYVSCNPATFARDAKLLVDGGYRFESVQPVGQFRWSTHVELAAIFRR